MHDVRRAVPVNDMLQISQENKKLTQKLHIASCADQRLRRCEKRDTKKKWAEDGSPKEPPVRDLTEQHSDCTEGVLSRRCNAAGVVSNAFSRVTMV